ncbi:hypothetical protein METHPM2_1900006 [Pseudomonas sp. PM2]
MLLQGEIGCLSDRYRGQARLPQGTGCEHKICVHLGQLWEPGLPAMTAVQAPPPIDQTFL